MEAATIGHNSKSALAILSEDPAAIYREPSMLEDLKREIRAEIQAHDLKSTTKAGREQIASLAHSISRRKTPILDAGKKLTEDWRKKTAAVNEIKAKVEKEMDALRDEARAPLDAWEAEEKRKTDDFIRARDFYAEVLRLHDGIPPTVLIGRLGHAWMNSPPKGLGDERDALLEGWRTSAFEHLHEVIAVAEKREADRAELERLRAAEAERERLAAEERRKADAEAAEKARIEAAERRAAEEAIAAERARARAEIDKANRERAELEFKMEAERQAKLREAREAAARQADIEHRGAVMKAAKEALMQHGGIKEVMAKKIVLAITGGNIPNVQMEF